MRAVEPRRRGTVDRDGVRIAYELFGDLESERPWVLLLPSWSIIHSRIWKHQVGYLARHFRVITFDGRGNGRSDRPRGPEHYTHDRFVADAVAVLDVAGARRAVVVGFSVGAHWAALLAAGHPERVEAAALIAPGAPLGIQHPERARHSFGERLGTREGWARFNRHEWLRDYPGFARFFMERTFSEPYSSRGVEDAVAWALETTPEVLIDTVLGGREGSGGDGPAAEEIYRSLRCPVLVLHGTEDRILPHRLGERVAELTGGRFVSFEGSGHGLPAREPVRVNLLLEELVRCTGGPDGLRGRRDRRRWAPGRSRPPRALFLSSPIGLGHARRDLAVARELRKLRPELQVEWLAQHPVTTLLDAAGERIHPGSRLLASECRHLEALAGEHSLHVYRAYRSMDEVFSANFMVFQEVVEEGLYDLVVADEAWEVDHFWHENPELKRGAYAWLTDFVGFLPVPGGGGVEARQTAEDNAEMLEHVARYPRIRDRALFVGDPADVVPCRFGPGLPRIRTWAREHFDFVGAIPGFDPEAGSGEDPAGRSALRAALGWGLDEPVCVVAVGGSGVGECLLRRAVAAFPEARRRVPGLRLVAVAGPRIDPGTLPAGPGAPEGLEIHRYVHGLHRYLAACDLAVVQGGLGTTLELTALRRPFLYVPVRGHFEQQIHVRHRLERHRAGTALDYDETTPDRLAAAIAGGIGAPTDGYLPVPGDGAARAARRLAELL